MPTATVAVGEDGWLYVDDGVDGSFGGQWKRIGEVGLNCQSVAIDGDWLYGVTRNSTVEIQPFDANITPDRWEAYAKGRVRHIVMHNGYLHGSGVEAGIFRWVTTDRGTAWQRISKSACRAIAGHNAILYATGESGDWMYRVPFSSIESRWEQVFVVLDDDSKATRWMKSLSSFVVLDDSCVVGVSGGQVVHGRYATEAVMDWALAATENLACEVRSLSVAADAAVARAIAGVRATMPSAFVRPTELARSCLDSILLENVMGMPDSDAWRCDPEVAACRDAREALPCISAANTAFTEKEIVVVGSVWVDGADVEGYLGPLHAGDFIRVLHCGQIGTEEEGWLYGCKIRDKAEGWLPSEIISHALPNF